MTKVELVKGQTFEVDPDKKYLIIFDKKTISRESVYLDLAKALEDEGIHSHRCFDRRRSPVGENHRRQS